MDFSPEIMIDFGFNLAGYLVVTLLICVLLRRRKARHQTPVDGNPNESEDKVKSATQETYSRSDPSMEYVSLAASDSDDGNNSAGDAHRAAASGPASRQENRRAIYREARRLLARGKSGKELIGSLPLTEDEIEMLSVSGQA
jgi:hypothetical protein